MDEPLEIKNEPAEHHLHPPATEQSTNMANPMLLYLNYSIRDQLITCLNEQSAIMQVASPSNPIPQDTKDRMREKIGKLVIALFNLPKCKPTPSPQDSRAFEERALENLTIEISPIDQANLMQHLMANQNTILFDQFDQRVADQSVADLMVAENRRIVKQFLDLSYGPAADQANERRTTSPDNSEPSRPQGRKRRRVDPDETENTEDRPNESDLKALTERQAEEITALKTRISELKLAIRNEGITREATSFKFELVGVSQFLQNLGNERESARFWCRGAPWSIRAKFNRCGKQKYLGLFIICHTDHLAKWSCRADYKLILFRAKQENFVMGGADTFRNAEDAWGHCDFIPVTELTDKKNGFITDDKIVIGAELQAQPIVEVINSA